jgi:hypothetical protein
MTKRKLNNSEVRAEQVASPKPPTLKLGLDVHADTIVVVRLLDRSAPQPAQKFAPAKFLECGRLERRCLPRVNPPPFRDPVAEKRR